MNKWKKHHRQQLRKSIKKRREFITYLESLNAKAVDTIKKLYLPRDLYCDCGKELMDDVELIAHKCRACLFTQY